MRLRNVVLLALAFAMAPAVYAEDYLYTGTGDYQAANWYFGLTTNGIDFARTGTLDHTYSTYGYTGALGYGMGKYLAIEARVGSGGNDTDANGLSMEAQRLSAAYVRINLPFDEGKVNLYLLGGYASVNVKASLSTTTTTTTGTKTFNGASYGGGLELYGNRTTALYVEYVSYLSKKKFTSAALGLAGDKFDVTATSVGIVHHF